jgi:hypothetical protein
MRSSAPSLSTIARKDYLASYFTTFLIITLLVYIGLLAFRPPLEIQPHLLLILLVLELIALVVRVSKVRSLLLHGTAVEGTVDRVYRVGTGAGSRTRVEYVYQYEGVEHRGGYPKGRSFAPGQRITVMVDPRTPRKSLIRDIFTR